jgi:tetratricopeptide (TPR) repeat protein
MPGGGRGSGGVIGCGYQGVSGMFRVFFLVIVATMAAQASAMTIGSSYARGCFEAATTGRSLKDGLRLCNSALVDEALALEHRAATLVNRGIVQMQARDFGAAIVDFDEAIRLRPETAEAYINKAIVLQRMGGRDGEAVALLSEGLARNPLRPEIAYYQRAMANEELGRVREAYEDYSRAAALAPEWPDPAEQLQRFQMVRRKVLAG